MTTRSAARTELYQDMLENVDVAVLSWGRGEWTFEGDADELTVLEYGDGSECLASYPVTIETIAAGWQRLLELERAGKWRYSQDIKRPIAAAERQLAEGETPDVDPLIIDAVVQAAIMGEVRYG